jgi:hypothetical protein
MSWQREMREFHRQTKKGGGAFEATIIRPEYQLAMIEAGKGHYLETIAQWVKVVRDGDKRPLCLACEHEFRRRERVPAFCFTIPFCNEPTKKALLTGICGKCSEKDDAELLEIAYRGFKEMGLAQRKLEPGTA